MFKAGFEQSAFKDLQRILMGLYRVMVQTDAMLAEINPLAVTEDGEGIAADAKFDIDDNALSPAGVGAVQCRVDRRSG
jgi:succinyl-CoA synthetase beta subunit